MAIYIATCRQKAAAKLAQSPNMQCARAIAHARRDPAGSTIAYLERFVQSYNNIYCHLLS
jgi:hypothetical protein